jgi:agmatinase
MANLGNMYGPKFTFLGIGECDLDDPKTYKGTNR